VTIIPRRAAPLNPTSRDPYFDKIQFWVHTPLNRKTLAGLRKECGRGGLYVDNRPARFDRRYRQRIEFKQPLDQALRWLAQCDEALINRAEIAIDLVFRSWAERDDAKEFLHQHFVRRWHGKNQPIWVFEAGARYDGPRRAPNRTAFYQEEHSRITGEVCVLHVEWRLNGLQALRRAGITSGQDLLEFNHRQFWQKRLLLYEVDCQRLGRLIRNCLSGKRSRVSVIKQTSGYRVNIDGRTGETHRRVAGTIQELIDNLARVRERVRVKRALLPLSNETLLPEVVSRVSHE
jgi:hypothetical protein